MYILTYFDDKGYWIQINMLKGFFSSSACTLLQKIIRHPQTSFNTHNLIPSQIIYEIFSHKSSSQLKGSLFRWEVYASLTQFVAIKQSFLSPVHARSFGKLPPFDLIQHSHYTTTTGQWLPLSLKHNYTAIDGDIVDLLPRGLLGDFDDPFRPPRCTWRERITRAPN